MDRIASGSLIAQADFGRTAQTRSNLILATSYRLIVAALIVALILTHLPFAGRAAPLLITLLAGYLLFVLARFTVLRRHEQWYYTPPVQFWRAHLSILCVTVLLFALGAQGEWRLLWILYIPALFLLSRYGPSQRTYLFAAAEVALLTAAARLLALRPTGRAPGGGALELLAAAAAVVLPTFLIHYLARVHSVTYHGVAVRDQIVRSLLERVLLEQDGLALWGAIRDACQCAAGASTSQIYLVDHSRSRLTPIVPRAEGFGVGERVDLFDEHPASVAVRTGTVIEHPARGALALLAVPITGRPNRLGRPLAVVVLTFSPPAADRQAPRQFVANLLAMIRPICIHADVRQRFPLVDQVDPGGVQTLCVAEVVSRALDTVVDTLGFSYATISLVDQDRQEIATVDGRGVPEGWIRDARHRLDSSDIQADVVASGKTVVLDGWDPRLDPEIWERYQHDRLVRAWIPLGDLGTIEAGFVREEHATIPEQLIVVLRRYAHIVAGALHNAQLFEREQRYSASLTRLAEASVTLQSEEYTRDERGQDALLQQIAESAKDVLRADLVMLYPRRRDDDGFGTPIATGDIIGVENQPLHLPNLPNNIVRHIADTRQPYYQSDVRNDPLFVKAVNPGGSRRARRRRTFSERQEIVSFAGVPLMVGGQVLGVLCVNYRTRHEFADHDHQLLPLYAQYASAVLVSHQLVRAQERRRLEGDLHDMVKTSIRGLILLSRAASDVLPDTPALAREHLHEVRRAAWGVLGDVDLILNDLSPDGHQSQVLASLIRDDIARLVGHENRRVAVACPTTLPPLPLNVLRALLRAIRESVMNAVDHSGAANIKVQLSHCTRLIYLDVIDDGEGFDVDAALRVGHRGLQIMRERVEAINGMLTIESAPGKGTRLHLQLPYQEGGA
jgi:signal transduction histidine kinase